MTLSRRSLITGLISLVAAPAIVRVSSLMPVKVMEPKLTIEQLLKLRIADAERCLQDNITKIVYGDRSLSPVKFQGIELFFDNYAPKDTVYFIGRQSVAWWEK